MTFAQIIDGDIVTVAGRLPNAARRLDSQGWVTPHDGEWSQTEHEACGWFTVADTVRPDDTDTTTTDRTVELVAGVPTVVWTARPLSTDELATRTQEANRTTIDTAITNALDQLQQLVNAPDVPEVPAGTLTTAQLASIVRAMRDVVQQNRNGIKRTAATLRQTIRLVRGDFDGVA